MKKAKLVLNKKLSFTKENILPLNGMNGIVGGESLECMSNACGSVNDTLCAGPKPTLVVACSPTPPLSVPYTCVIESNSPSKCCVLFP